MIHCSCFARKQLLHFTLHSREIAVILLQQSVVRCLSYCVSFSGGRSVQILDFSKSIMQKKNKKNKHHNPTSEGPVFRQMVPPACSFISMVGRAMHRSRRPCSASGPRHSVYPSCPAKEPIGGGSGFPPTGNLHSYLSVPPGSTVWFLPAQLSRLRLAWLVSG